MKFNIRYNLRKKASKRAEKIYLICRFAGEKFVYPTAYSILPKHWNVKTGEIRNVIEELNRDIINNHLRELKAAAKDIYDKTIASRMPVTKQLLKSELDKWTGKTVIDKPIFWTWTRKYIDDSPKRINPKTGRIISPRTIQEYETTFTYLKEFEQTNREELDYHTIDLNTLKDFRDYLTTVKGFALNNIAKHIDGLRQFLRAADADKISIDSDTINPKRFTIAREEPEDIYLNEIELQHLASFDLSDHTKYITIEETQKGKKRAVRVSYSTLDRVRDLFVIGCHTGLRVSDYNNIKPHNVKGEFLDLYQYKGGKRVVVPIHNTVKEILTKYGGKTPPKISDQKINQYIKEICRLAGFTEDIEKRQTKGGELVATILKKWQLVKSHTGRRSFASNMTRKGIPIQQIMQITGHKKESVFLKYVKLTAMEHAEIMREHMLTGNKNIYNLQTVKGH
jgi:integrase